MNFFDWLTTKRKTLSTMSVAELRAQEMLLENDRNRMLRRVEKLATDKQGVVERGAKEKTPEMRRTFAQQFDLLHTEQMMLSRHLNIRSKELLTVSRLRMLREMSRQSVAGPGLVAIGESDLAAIERLIENNEITAELYSERLDEILKIGHAADTEASAGVSPAAQELMRIWSDMDAGLIKDTATAVDEAERRVREREREGA
ncbi:MAG: hypothetical protein KDA32_01380 [Phycisphaerales bacterium]|nr:hypothetical protein [Phycisphaerales bacterium]